MEKGYLNSEVLLEKLIGEVRKDYPYTLRVRDLEKIIGCSKTQAYSIVKYLPGAKKLSFLGWRIPRDPFFAWYYFNKPEIDDDNK